MDYVFAMYVNKLVPFLPYFLKYNFYPICVL